LAGAWTARDDFPPQSIAERHSVRRPGFSPPTAAACAEVCYIESKNQLSIEKADTNSL
jgi:hypothetical protein